MPERLDGPCELLALAHGGFHLLRERGRREVVGERSGTSGRRVKFQRGTDEGEKRVAPVSEPRDTTSGAPRTPPRGVQLRGCTPPAKPRPRGPCARAPRAFASRRRCAGTSSQVHARRSPARRAYAAAPFRCSSQRAGRGVRDVDESAGAASFRSERRRARHCPFARAHRGVKEEGGPDGQIKLSKFVDFTHDMIDSRLYGLISHNASSLFTKVVCDTRRLPACTLARSHNDVAPRRNVASHGDGDEGSRRG